MSETIDLLARQVGGGCHQILVFLGTGQSVGHGGGIYMPSDERVVNESLGILLLTLQIDLYIPAA